MSPCIAAMYGDRSYSAVESVYLRRVAIHRRDARRHFLSYGMAALGHARRSCDHVGHGDPLRARRMVDLPVFARGGIELGCRDICGRRIRVERHRRVTDEPWARREAVRLRADAISVSAVAPGNPRWSPVGVW